MTPGSCGELCWDLRLCWFPAWVLGVQPTNIYLAGDCRFVSATFRLFKLPGSSQAGPGQVIYNGGIVGHERELVFDANFTFKVWGDRLGLPRMPGSPGLWGWDKADGTVLLSSILCDFGGKLWERGWWAGAKGLYKPGEEQTGVGKGARPLHCVGVKVGAGHLWWLHRRA